MMALTKASFTAEVLIQLGGENQQASVMFRICLILHNPPPNDLAFCVGPTVLIERNKRYTDT